MSPMQWFSDWLTWFAQFMQDAIVAVLHALDPVQQILGIVLFVVSFLPEQDPRLLLVINNMLQALVYLVEYFQLADFIINLPFLYVCFGIVLATESALGVIRAWRILRSFIT